MPARPANAARAAATGHRFRRGAEREAARDEAVAPDRLGQRPRRLARAAPERKQQPVGLSEEQLRFAAGGGQGPGPGENQGPLPGPAGCSGSHRQGLQSCR